MPAFDVLVILFVFCGPGMLFWFFEGQAKHLKQDRPFWIQVAGGAALTLLYYAFLELCGLIQLGSILNGKGQIDILLLLEENNLCFYLLSVVLFSILGFVWGRFAADFIQLVLIGKTSKTSWLNAFGTISKEYGYATLYTKNGEAWWGSLRSMPAVPDPSDVIVLDEPQYQHTDSDKFVLMDADYVAVPLGDIKALLIRNVSPSPLTEPDNEWQQPEIQSASSTHPTAGKLECTIEAGKHQASSSAAHAKTEEQKVITKWSWIERGED